MKKWGRCLVAAYTATKLTSDGRHGFAVLMQFRSQYQFEIQPIEEKEIPSNDSYLHFVTSHLL